VSAFSWTAETVCRLLGCQSAPEDADLTFETVSTDTRSLGAGSLFVALVGERFDAHDFLGAAADAGARGALVSRIPDDAPRGIRYFVVADTLVALGDLARHRRRSLAARVIAVAGSNGKTTTKDLLRAALATRFRVHATQGNLNNRIGLPLTLLATPADAEILVLEMGTDEPGEIRELCRIAEPDLGTITSIGEEHLEKLGDLRGVLDEETELLKHLPDDAVAVVAEEPRELPERSREILGADRVRIAGFGEDADLHPDQGIDGVEVLPDGTTQWSWRGTPFHVPIPGRHNVRNALLAVGIADQLGVSAQEAAGGIGAMPSPKLRGEWHRIGAMRVLADCYNANPPSLAAAVDLLVSLPTAGEKVAVVGTMRELGPTSDELHRRSAELLAARLGAGIDRVIATGDFVRAFDAVAAGLGERLVVAEDPVAAFEAAAESFAGTETILLKGSRGVALERWIPLLRRRWGEDRGMTNDE
jgi:UDP-N-acetylmuramoyl-tripeptide--D-alanyl-D-alanine ligase